MAFRMTASLPDYPDINFPLPLPEWFPEWQFMTIIKGETLETLVEEE